MTSHYRKSRIVLRNGEMTASFRRMDGGLRPEWFRLGSRPMLRFKDHEWLNIGAMRITAGSIEDVSADRIVVGGTAFFAGTPVRWRVSVSLPPDRQTGFAVRTEMEPLEEPIEVLEAMSAFETPYEYDGTERIMTVISQQPVYRFEGERELNGAGFMHPIWYYGRPGRAHLTAPSSSPLLACRIAADNGLNERCVMLIGNWHATSVKDIFAQPTRALGAGEAEPVFPDRNLRIKPGLRGMKFLMGAVNWNNSLHKDPNVLAEPGTGLCQELIVDFLPSLPDGRWDGWLAAGWERMVRLHLPQDGRVPAYYVARSRGASWIGAAEWLGSQLAKDEGCPGFFYREKGTCVYAPGTRPKWDEGVALFSGQFAGPLAYLGLVWADRRIARAADTMERLFLRDKSHRPDHIWTIGPTPIMTSILRKASVSGVSDRTLAAVRDYVRRRTEFVLDPPPGSKRGDAGILAWDAYANLLAADLFEPREREAAGMELLRRVNRKLDEEFWKFNCAAEGDLVGAGNARPFGHGIAIHANILAWRRSGDESFLEAAARFGNLLLSMHVMAANTSESPDLDTRGWCHGSTGGRDQIAQMPPWETGFSLQQLAPLILAGRGRPGMYDALWLFSRTGLCQYPIARIVKRIYTPAMSVTYRPIDSLPTEREFYLKLPYLAYENPWDQTMLAGYQGVEGIILSLFLGGGLVEAEDERVLALVPAAAAYDTRVAGRFETHLWNPTGAPVATALVANIAARRRRNMKYSGAASGSVSFENLRTRPVTIPPRRVIRIAFSFE